MNATNSTFGIPRCNHIQLNGRQVLSEDKEAAVRYLTVGFLALLYPFAIILNSLVIFLVLKFKHLRQTTYYLALQLIIIDLVICIFFTPITVINAFAGRWILGLNFCRIVGAVNSFLRQMRNLFMFIFVCDRFLAVFYPFSYPRVQKKVISFIYTGSLMLAVVTTAIPLADDCVAFSRVAWYCLIDVGCTTPLCSISRSVIASVSTLIGAIIPFAMYIILFIKAKKIRNQITPMVSEELTQQRRHNKRANTTFFTVFLSTFAVSFLTFLFFAVIRSITAAFGVHTHEVFLFASFLLRLNFDLLLIFDPIAILRNPEVREALKVLKNNLKCGEYPQQQNS